MFQLYYDTRSEALAETLARLLVETGTDNPLRSQTVLVPQLGLEKWLARTLAERHGIAANIEFVEPARFARQLLRTWRPELAARSPFDRDLLQWRLQRLLLQVAAGDAKLAGLLDGVQPSLRRLQLAGQLAHLFERYQAYRPQVLQGWLDSDKDRDFQAQLWRALAAECDEPPRSRLLTDYIARFGAAGAEPPPGLPSHVFAWGCINVSPLVLDLLRVVSRHVDLHFLMPTPCGEYWGDLPRRRDLMEYLGGFADGFLPEAEAPNRLLVSLGGVGREFVARVFADDAVQMLAADGEEGEPARGTLLERVQADIITLAQPDAAARLSVPDPVDNSIQIEVCHSPLREVQVLHDHLLDLLTNDPTLEPRDIVVMTPDVKRYAAAVEAVFGAIDEGDTRHLPWTVADRPAADAHPLTALFVQLLGLPATRLGLDLVLEVLEVAAVQRAAGLEGDELNHLQSLAVEAGIRWGEDADDREAAGLPRFDDFSFSFGRRRLLLGYLLGDGEDEGLVDSIAPLGDIEGDMAHAFGALVRLERQLHELQQAMRTPHPPQQWQDLFNVHLGRMLAVADDDRDGARALADVRQALSSLVEDSQAAGFAEPLDWLCLRELLAGRLGESRAGQRFLDGGVSVCSMVPLRDVPFRVVCVLGLEADAFPRRDEADVLSLIQRDSRLPGDRSVREDDRYLFLQTIMAARQHLYFSWTGIDLQSGRKREPSVLLAEFIEHVCEGYFTDAEKARAALVVEQPMHPFSPRLFAADEAEPRIFTYRQEWREAAAGGQGEAAVPVFANADWPADEADRRVDLTQLKRFFAAPQRAFLRQHPGLAINPIDEETGREPLVLDPLPKSWMQRQLLQQLLREADADDKARIASLRARALLPPLAVGQQAYVEARDLLQPQALAWREWADDDAPQGQPCSFELDLGADGVLHGTVDGVLEHGFAGWVGGVNSAHRWFKWWLDALAYRAAINPAGECRAFGINHDKAKLKVPLTAHMPDRAVAIAELRKLVGIMRTGLHQPLLLPPRSGWALAETLAGNGLRRSPDKDPVPRAFSEANKRWREGDWPENADAWIGMVLRGREPFADPASELGQACLQLARELYLPAWQALLGEAADVEA